jgi:drug/metabolite transporter (DMT)-like permease
MPYIGELYSLLTACFWSGSSIAFTAATRRIGSVQVNTSRLIMAAGYLGLLLLVARPAIDLSTTQILYLSISGCIGFTLGDTFLFQAFKQIGARMSMLVMSLAPAAAALLGLLLLDEELPAWGVAGIAVTIAGIGIVVLEQRSAADGPTAAHRIVRGGFALALLAAIGQGSGLVFAKMAFREGDINGFVATFVRILASLVVLLPLSVLSGRYRKPIQVLRNDRTALFHSVLGSILGPFLGVTSSLLAIQHTKVGVAATIMATTPIVMLPIVHFVQKEQLGWRAVAGAVIATLGVALLFLH